MTSGSFRTANFVSTQIAGAPQYARKRSPSFSKARVSSTISRSLPAKRDKIGLEVHVGPVLRFGDRVDDLGEHGLGLAVLHHADHELDRALRLFVRGNSRRDVENAAARYVGLQHDLRGRRGGQHAQAHVVDVDHPALHVGHEGLSLAHHLPVHEVGGVDAEIDALFPGAGGHGCREGETEGQATKTAGS